MNIEFKCPQCRNRVVADEKYQGKVLRCPHCEKGIVVPKNGTPWQGPIATTVKCPHCGTEYEVTEEDMGNRTQCEMCGKMFSVMSRANSVRIPLPSSSDGGTATIDRQKGIQRTEKIPQTSKSTRKRNILIVSGIGLIVIASVVSAFILSSLDLELSGESSSEETEVRTIEGLMIKPPEGSRFKRLLGDSKTVCYCASLPANCDDEWDDDPEDGPKVFINISKWNPRQNMEEFVYGLCKEFKGKEWKPVVFAVESDRALLGASGDLLGRKVAQYIKVIRDVSQNRTILITGTYSFEMLLASTKDKDPQAKKIIHTVHECVDSASLSDEWD